MDTLASPAGPSEEDAEHRAEPASDVLEGLLEAFPNEQVTVGEMIDQLDTRAHGVLLLILALPMCLPNVPGISTIFGVLMLAPSVQMMFGARKLWLPQQARAWGFKRSSLTGTVTRAIPLLRRVEYLIKPRLTFLTRGPAIALVGLQTFIMALILILPLWGANFTPGITVTMTALALLQRDGALMLLSSVAALGSIAWVYFTAKFSLAAFQYFVEGLQALLAGGGN